MSNTLSRTNHGTILAVAVLSLLCAGIPSFFIGLFAGYLRNDIERGNRDVDDVKEFISTHPETFATLRINRGPADKFLIEGSVKTRQDLDRLRDTLVRRFGERRARDILAVTVRGEEGR